MRGLECVGRNHPQELLLLLARRADNPAPAGKTKLTVRQRFDSTADRDAHLKMGATEIE